MTLTISTGAPRLLRVVWTAVTLGVGIAATVFRGWLPMWYGFVWCVVAVAWVWGVFVHVPRYCRAFGGEYDGQAVCWHGGVWWRRETRVPLSALRTFEVWAPPLHRLFRCRTMVLRFAGGSAWLPLLSESLAAALTAHFEGDR